MGAMHDHVTIYGHVTMRYTHMWSYEPPPMHLAAGMVITSHHINGYNAWGMGGGSNDHIWVYCMII